MMVSMLYAVIEADIPYMELHVRLSNWFTTYWPTTQGEGELSIEYKDHQP